MSNMIIRNCCWPNCKDEDGNCQMLGADKLPVQCVGSWVEDKFYFLEKYLNASSEARRKFADKNNAVFIDLFSGPGKCIIKDEKREIDSGGFRAFHRDEAPFNEYFCFDISESNTAALNRRINTKTNCHVQCGDSNILIKELVPKLLKQKYRYHFAFIDPFGPDGLKFDTLKMLAKLDRMDMMIHFPIGAIKRNVKSWMKNDNNILDNFLGTNAWRNAVKGVADIYQPLINVFEKQLESIGYPEAGLKMASSSRDIPAVSVRNNKNVDLYVLILASKHPLGQNIWNNIIKIDPQGQKTLF